MISESVRKAMETAAGERMMSARSVTGGCISQAFALTFRNGKKMFLKYDPRCGNDMFLKEANGLRELSSGNALRVPEVIMTDRTFILMEYIQGKPRKKNFFGDFGHKFSLLHRKTSEVFGFYEDNFIGSNDQLNVAEGKEKTDWATFYTNKRILLQYRLAEKNGYATEELKRVVSILVERICEILSGSEEKPALLHGDLWSGNFITDETGSVCLIDPAVYYGHREADLAMTKMFGGFPDEFYFSYMENYPLPAGYSERENIYKLYHALNHLNLFGNSYYNQTLSLAKSYI